MKIIGIIAVTFLGVVAVILALGVAGFDTVKLHAADKETHLAVELEKPLNLTSQEE